MVSVNPADNTGGVNDSRGTAFKKMIAQQKEYINCIYNFGGDGNDPTKIDSRHEKESLASHLSQLKTWFNGVKEKFSSEEIKEVETLIAEQEKVLENCITEDDQDWWAGNFTPTEKKETPKEKKVTRTEPKAAQAESEWKTPEKGTYSAGTVMKTVKNEDGSYYEEYKNLDTGRTYISYDANGNRTGASWNTVINGTEYPTRKEWTDSEGKLQHINIEYDKQGNIVREYKDEDYVPLQREIKE